MNRREAAALRDVLEKLERGPSGGWRQTLDGREPGGAPTTLEERTRRVEIWLDSWILPAIKTAVMRYWRPTTGRVRGRITVPTTAARLRETLRAGEARQTRADRGGEDPPYWAGYYHSIAKQAIEELEARDAAAEGRS